MQEVRIEDYLKSYSAIGRAPAPCPQQPTNAAQREALGLPPLFQPYKESSLSTTKAPAAKEASPPPPTITNPADLPDAQAFLAPSAYGDPFQVQSISCTPGYSAFSHEVRSSCVTASPTFLHHIFPCLRNYGIMPISKVIFSRLPPFPCVLLSQL